MDNPQRMVVTIIASVVSAVVAVVLFMAREKVERCRRRKEAAAILSLYAMLVGDAVSRGGNIIVAFNVGDIAKGCVELADCNESAMLLVELTNALAECGKAYDLKRPIERDKRLQIGEAIKRRYLDHCIKNHLPSNLPVCSPGILQ